MIPDLFEGMQRDVPLALGAMVLGGFARPVEGPLVAALQRLVEVAPFRHMVTPGCHRMSIAMTNCGTVGWVSDRTGYRYVACDPESDRHRSPLPEVFGALATQAAERTGFGGFAPDACLINRYQPGARLSLHQDKNEEAFEAPIVSVSLGLPAIFLFGGMHRVGTARRVPLTHGDLVVWGGAARLRYYGVLLLKGGQHPLMDGFRINLMLRRSTTFPRHRWAFSRRDGPQK